MAETRNLCGMPSTFEAVLSEQDEFGSIALRRTGYTYTTRMPLFSACWALVGQLVMNMFTLFMSNAPASDVQLSVICHNAG